MDTITLGFTDTGELTIGEEILMTFSPYGEPETVTLPLDSPEKRGTLARALFDARETGDLPTNHTVRTPDGELFDFDKELYTYEQSGAYKQSRISYE